MRIEKKNLMKIKNICLSICLALEIGLLSGCTSNNAKDAADSIEQFGKDVADQLENLTDADDPNVLAIKNGYHQDNPNITYGDAFEDFFAYPTWKYFKAESGEEVVEFSGRCTYRDVEVKAILQFILNEDKETFTVGALSFNDIPQDQFTVYSLLSTVFNEYADNHKKDMESNTQLTETINSLTGITEEDSNEEWIEETEPGADVRITEGNYLKTIGPKCELSIRKVNERGISFSVRIGGSGNLAYVDMRNCQAQWIDKNTAAYEENGYQIKITVEDTQDFLRVSENRPSLYFEDFSLSGIYIIESMEEENCEFVFPEDNVYKITEEDLEGKTAMECKIARNEIYARYGRIFKDEQLQGYFNTCDWYNGTIAPEQFSESTLNEIEKANIQMIANYESKLNNNIDVFSNITVNEDNRLEEGYTDYREWGGSYDDGWLDTILMLSLYSDETQSPQCGSISTYFRGMETWGKLYYLGGNEFCWESEGDSSTEIYYVRAVKDGSAYQLELYNSGGEYEVTFTQYEQLIP